jgi:hypothetical protein
MGSRNRAVVGGFVRGLALILKFWSYLFALILGIFLTGMALVFMITDATNVKFDALPFWKGDTLIYWLLGLGLTGILAVVLAVLKKFKALLVLFTLAAFCLMVYGFFISPVYRFYGADPAKGAAWLAFGALGAFFGSLFQFEKPRRA